MKGKLDRRKGFGIVFLIFYGIFTTWIAYKAIGERDLQRILKDIYHDQVTY